MKKQKLYIMCGCPGAGKTTYAKENLVNSRTIYVSRDEIRFSIVAEDESYFSKEATVYKIFITNINEALKRGYDVVADATHLNHKSRMKLFNKLAYSPFNVETTIVFLCTPVEECIERNKLRLGTRAYVPEDKIFQMYENLERPFFNEYPKIDNIYIVYPRYTMKLNREECETEDE